MNTQAPYEKPNATNPLPAIAAMPGTPLLKKLIGQGPRRPTPTPDEVALVLPVAKLLAAALAPAKPARAAQLIARLVGHYPQQAMADDIRAGIAEDWLEDLAHLPEDVIDAACAGWRRAENKFAPTPGQFLAIANPIVTIRRFLAQQGAQITGLPEAKAAQPVVRREAP
jgi:hypothetical protein